MNADKDEQRIGIIVVAYNAASTLAKTLDRIPHDFRHRIAEVIVCDDASEDGTFDLGQEWAARPDSPPTRVIRHTKNLGYGGNQKAAYALAIERGLDIVVLLHGDGQYAPECLPDMVAPFADRSSSVSAVFGSRMLVDGAAREGGMPMYKRIGNRILTQFENRMLGTTLSEFHSGYRAYSTEMLRQIPFAANTDDFDFDTQIIAQIVHAGGTIVEIPIPTYYGDEICYVNGMKYARDVVKDVLQYRLAVRGFGTPEWIAKPDAYSFKEGDGTSHAEILDMLEGLPPARILDVGCSGGLLAEKMRAGGHYVVGIDSVEIPGVKDRVDEFHLADLDTGLPEEVGAGFDVVVTGDVIEHLTKPGAVLRSITGVLAPRGQLLLSVPNFSHWYPRTRVMLGAFGYDRRGILDETHVRFFTRASLRRIVRESGLDILEERATGLPFGVVTGHSEQKSLVRRIDRALVGLRPTLFGYQNIFRLTPHAEEMIEVVPIKIDADGNRDERAAAC